VRSSITVKLSTVGNSAVDTAATVGIVVPIPSAAWVVSVIEAVVAMVVCRPMARSTAVEMVAVVAMVASTDALRPSLDVAAGDGEGGVEAVGSH
jgi:hypothetical protein